MIDEKVKYDTLIVEGWKDTDKIYADLKILSKGEYKILYDAKDNRIWLRYKL